MAGKWLVASITVEAVEELGLAEGSKVTALIKASAVILATAELKRQPEIPGEAVRQRPGLGLLELEHEQQQAPGNRAR